MLSEQLRVKIFGTSLLAVDFAQLHFSGRVETIGTFEPWQGQLESSQGPLAAVVAEFPWQFFAYGEDSSDTKGAHLKWFKEADSAYVFALMAGTHGPERFNEIARGVEFPHKRVHYFELGARLPDHRISDFLLGEFFPNRASLASPLK